METFLWSLLTLGLTAAAWIAYTHPREYRTFVLPLISTALAVVMTGLITYSVGIDHSALATYEAKSLRPDQSYEVRNLIRARKPSDHWILGVAFLCAYALALSLLEPMGLTKADPSKPAQR